MVIPEQKVTAHEAKTGCEEDGKALVMIKSATKNQQVLDEIHAAGETGFVNQTIDNTSRQAIDVHFQCVSCAVWMITVKLSVLSDALGLVSEEQFVCEAVSESASGSPVILMVPYV